MYKISVIIPVFNLEKKIEKTLDSLCNQTYKNFELIIIDDGSEKQIAEVCDEFEKNYGSIIKNIVDNNSPGTIRFIMGDYYGVDIMAQNTLMDVFNYPTEKVTVYHMYDKPRNINPLITQTVGDFKTDEERDYAMSRDSDEDIAFVRWGKFKSGTAQNIIRRHAFFSNTTEVNMYLK